MKRTLALKKDTLTELGSAELGEVVGGSAATCYTCVQLNCLVGHVQRAISTLGIERPALPSLDTPCS